MSEFSLNIRGVGTARGEREFCRETTLKVRWPRRDGVTWHGWEAKEGPGLDELMEHARVVIAETGGVIVGFAMWRRDQALNMLYVKHGLRGCGFGKALLGAWLQRPELKVIEPTPCWKRWSDHHGIKWDYADYQRLEKRA